MVKVELDLVRRRRDRLGTRVLDLLDEVLVRLLGEAAALLRVEVDVVDIERGRSERTNTRSTDLVDAVRLRLEVDVDADLVVLEGNERDSNTRIAAEPELERDVERLRRRTVAANTRRGRLARRARGIKGNTRRILDKGKVRRVTDHRVERTDRTRLRGELRPDLHPVTILAIDTLATDLNLNLLDEAVTNVVNPAEGRTRLAVNLRENDLDVRLVHKIGVTVDDSRNTTIEISLAVERHLNRLDGEVRVALVEDLPERDLGIAGDIDILRTVGDKLHKTRNSMT